MLLLLMFVDDVEVVSSVFITAGRNWGHNISILPISSNTINSNFCCCSCGGDCLSLPSSDMDNDDDDDDDDDDGTIAGMAYC